MFVRNGPPLVIAEVGSNHDGSLENALRYCEASAAAGAGAVKFQMFRTTTLVNPEVPAAQGQWGPHPALPILKALEVPASWIAPLKQRCDALGVLFTCTPFDEEAVRVLDAADVACIKVASGELTHRAFLEVVAATGRPVILSTGMGTLDEVRAAIGWLRTAGAGPLAVLHCVSNYPPRDEDANLSVLPLLASLEGVAAVGFSDHGPGSVLPAAAVMGGASVIEKHVTFDRALPGPDHAFAMTMPELARLVEDVKRVHTSRGNGLKAPVAAEGEMRIHARRGLWARRDLAAGTVLTREDIAVVRPHLPGTPGAERIRDYLGKPLKTAVKAFRPLPG